MYIYVYICRCMRMHTDMVMYPKWQNVLLWVGNRFFLVAFAIASLTISLIDWPTWSTPVRLR